MKIYLGADHNGFYFKKKIIFTPNLKKILIFFLIINDPIIIEYINFKVPRLNF